MTPSTDLTGLAVRAADALRDVLAPYFTKETRREVFQAHREYLAKQMAEDETGVTFNEARLTSIYSYSQLTPRQVERSKLYNAALIRAYQTLDLDLPGLLQFCDDMTQREAA